MAIPVVNGTNSTGTLTSGTTLGVSHTVGTGLTDSILTAIVVSEPTTFRNASSATWNGVPMLKFDGTRSTLFWLRNPASGSHTCTVNWGGTVKAVAVSLITFTGAQGVTFITSDSIGGTSTTAEVMFTSHNNNGTAVDVCFSQFTSHIQGAGQTEQTNTSASDGTNTFQITTSTKDGAAASGTNDLAVTLGLSKTWGITGFQVEAYEAFADVVPQPYLL